MRCHSRPITRQLCFSMPAIRMVRFQLRDNGSASTIGLVHQADAAARQPPAAGQLGIRREDVGDLRLMVGGAKRP